MTLLLLLPVSSLAPEPSLRHKLGESEALPSLSALHTHPLMVKPLWHMLCPPSTPLLYLFGCLGSLLWPRDLMLQSMGSRAHSSAVGSHESRHTGSQFPNQGSNPCALLWKVDSLCWTIRGVPCSTTCICYRTWVSRHNGASPTPSCLMFPHVLLAKDLRPT